MMAADLLINGFLVFFRTPDFFIAMNKQPFLEYLRLYIDTMN